MTLEAVKYERGILEILDQLRLPHEHVYVKIKTVSDAWNAIKSMQVRGAPAIAIVAALSLAVQLASKKGLDFPDGPTSSTQACVQYISQELQYLVTSRPTAVNLADAVKKLNKVVRNTEARKGSNTDTVSQAYIEAAEQMLADDVRDNRNIGEYGASWIQRNASCSSKAGQLSVITHCNTGSLATAGYGTALGVIRSLHASGVLRQAFYTETRPYNQGSRLTGYELIHDMIPATLITDSMAAALLKLKTESENIACIVVGADRVAANGDTANKIGTYALSILARFHKVKFLVAAPRTTIDLDTASGSEITIEERSPDEVVLVKGPSIQRSSQGGFAVDPKQIREIGLAAANTNAWNPAFDVTPAELIDGIVTEKGVVEKDQQGRYDFTSIFDESEAIK